MSLTFRAVSIGYNIVIFAKTDEKPKILIYNTKNNDWCYLNVNDLDNLWRISCVKFSSFNLFHTDFYIFVTTPYVFVSRLVWNKNCFVCLVKYKECDMYYNLNN